MSWVLLGLLGLTTTALSLFALMAEQSHLLAGGGSQPARVEAFVSGERNVGLSTTTQRWFVIDCRNSTIYAFANSADATVRERLPQRCLEGALDITDMAPSSSFAWFGAAHASLAMRNWEDMNAYMARSHATGANEGWIARYRAELAVLNYGRLSPDNQTLFRQDLELLAANMFAFSDFLATQYVNRLELRPLITEAVETTTPVNQRRFVAAVRRISGQAVQGQS